MAKIVLSVNTLGELDSGAAAAIINRELSLAVADLDDRGDDGKPRKVTIEVELKARDDGLVEASVRAQAKLPPRQTASTIAKVQRAGNDSQLLFQRWAPDNPEQRTLPVMDQDEEKE